MAIRSSNLRPAPTPVGDKESPASDYALVTRVKDGDLAAFELIMRRHNQRLFRLARGVVRDAPEAEDVVQEAYARAYAHIGDFAGPDGFSAWLGRIVLNEALGRLRRRGRVVSLDEPLQNADPSSNLRRLDVIKSQQPNPERLAASAELRRFIERAIDGLPDDFRTVFVLRGVEEMSIAETADHLSLPEATVKTRYHRAQRLLRKALGSELDALMPNMFEFLGARCDRIVAATLSRMAPASTR